jgi:putative aldouronate transport system substrate-binding protein
MPLDALLEEYGGGIMSSVSEELLSAHVYDGKTYAIATLRDHAFCLCFEYRKSIADAYGLDMSSVKTLEDLTAVLMELKHKNDVIVPISSYGIRSWDPLSDNLGVLMDNGRSKQVVNLFETEDYKTICETIRVWRQSGLLLNEDSALISRNNFVRTKDIFGKLGSYWPGLTHIDSVDAGEAIECVILGEPNINTDSIKSFCWGISAKSERPVEAMKFLNLMYSDPYVVNLLIYGIEGVHYEIVDAQKGVIDFPKDVSVGLSGYAQFRGYFWGNQFIGHVWNGWPVYLWARTQDFDARAIRSTDYGFSYDPSSVADLADACREVASKYTPLLETGYGDVHALLQEFNEALKDAGINQVIAEKQRQFDAWLATGGIR